MSIRTKTYKCYHRREIVTYLPKGIQTRLPKEVAVVSLSPKKSLAINRKYRKKDRPTNVLSFRFSDDYGEILVCPALIRREAREQGHSFEYQMTRVIVHAMLHLAGLHHEKSAAAARKTEAIERSVLTKVSAVNVPNSKRQIPNKSQKR